MAVFEVAVLHGAIHFGRAWIRCNQALIAGCAGAEIGPDRFLGLAAEGQHLRQLVTVPSLRKVTLAATYAYYSKTASNVVAVRCRPLATVPSSGRMSWHVVRPA